MLVSSDFIKEDMLKALNQSIIQYTRGVFFKTVSTNLSKLKIHLVDILVFYSPKDIDSLYLNFPDFKQNNIKIAVFGEATYQAAIDAGLNINIKAPTSEHPSMSMALDSHLKNSK